MIVRLLEKRGSGEASEAFAQNWGVSALFFRNTQNDQEKRGVAYKSFMQDAISLSRSSLIQIITVIAWQK